MRDRTTRAAPVRPTRATMATRQGVAFDAFDDLEDVEQKAASGGISFDQLDPQAIAQTIGFAGALADQELAALVVAEEFLAEAPDRDQPVGSVSVERVAQPKPSPGGLDPSP